MAKAKQHKRKRASRGSPRRNSRFEPSVLEREGDLGVRRVKLFRAKPMSHVEHKARKKGTKSTRSAVKSFKRQFGSYSGNAAPREPWTPRSKMPRLNSAPRWVSYSEKDAAAWAPDKSPDKKGCSRWTGAAPGDLVEVAPVLSWNSTLYMPGVYIRGRWLQVESAYTTVAAARKVALMQYTVQRDYEGRR